MIENISHYKTLLEEKKSVLELELSSLGVHDPSNPSEWLVKNPDLDIMTADENEVADMSEEVQVDSSILEELVIQHKNVVLALAKIEQGNYGICEVCAEQIAEKRLAVNPSARTCEEHLDQEVELG